MKQREAFGFQSATSREKIKIFGSCTKPYGSRPAFLIAIALRAGSEVTNLASSTLPCLGLNFDPLANENSLLLHPAPARKEQTRMNREGDGSILKKARLRRSVEGICLEKKVKRIGRVTRKTYYEMDLYSVCNGVDRIKRGDLFVHYEVRYMDLGEAIGGERKTLCWIKGNAKCIRSDGAQVEQAYSEKSHALLCSKVLR